VWNSDHETYLSTQQPAPQTHARLPSPHGYEKWSPDLGTSSRKGPQAADCLTDSSRPAEHASSQALGRAGNLPGNPAGSLPGKFKFQPFQRIRHKSEFDSVYRQPGQAQRFSDGLFTVLARPNVHPEFKGRPRLGLSIAARAVGNSVRRNRIKRLVRESFRLHQHRLPAFDLVVNARNAASKAPNRQVSESLEKHWRNVIITCARS
jgi:ribonuclease P protein component